MTIAKDFLEVDPDRNNALVPKKGVSAEIRIPSDNFDHKISEIIGGSVKTFGILDIYCWKGLDDTDDHKRSEAEVVKFRLPIRILTQPSRMYEDESTKEIVLQYFTDGLIMTTTTLRQDTSDVVALMTLIIRGKLPDDIPYDKIPLIWAECARIHNFNLGVYALFLDTVVAVVCRDPNNPARQFREAVKDNPRISMNSRLMVNMENIPGITSQFGAIASGNPKYGITSSIGAVNAGDMELIESDMERAIK